MSEEAKLLIEVRRETVMFQFVRPGQQGTTCLSRDEAFDLLCALRPEGGLPHHTVVYRHPHIVVYSRGSSAGRLGEVEVYYTLSGWLSGWVLELKESISVIMEAEVLVQQLSDAISCIDNAAEKMSPPQESDTINPDHYKVGGIETFDYLRAKLTHEELCGFCRGNALKYLSRAGRKGSAHEDYGKAQWYLNKLVELSGEDKR